MIEHVLSTILPNGVCDFCCVCLPWGSYQVRFQLTDEAKNNRHKWCKEWCKNDTELKEEFEIRCAKHKRSDIRALPILEERTWCRLLNDDELDLKCGGTPQHE